MSQVPQSSNDMPTETKCSRQFRIWWVLSPFLAVTAAVCAGNYFWQQYLLPQNCYRRGRAALEMSKRDKVLRESQRLMNVNGFQPHAHLLAGLLYLDERQLEKAISELIPAAQDGSIADKSITIEATTAAAKCYYMAGQFQLAVSAAQAALEKDPNSIEARRWLAAAYYDLGASSHAANELATISAQDPHDARADRLLGLIGKDSERFEHAVTYYRESLRRDPQQPDRQQVYEELAESLVKLSRFDEAVETLKECRRTPQTLTLSAECAQNLGRNDEAREAFREAIKLDPKYMPAHLKYGEFLLVLGQVEESVSQLEDAVRLAPANRHTHFHLSQAYTRQGRSEEADKQLKLMQQLQAIEHEFSQLHDTAAMNPEDADVRYRIGVLAVKLQKLELAQVWFRAALALNPQHRGALAALANFR